MKVSVKSTVTVPSAYVSKNRQRLKQYDNIVYLNNGNEFELELYNPTTNKVLAVIELNGKAIGSGIVLRPGERVFLERYLNDPRKFKFETYTVNGNSNEVKQAIANNGKVVVKFYAEQPIYTYANYTAGNCNPIYFSNPTYTVYPFTTINTGSSTLTGGSGSITTSSFLNSVGNTTNTLSYRSFPSEPPLSSHQKKSRSKEVETGRVEKGTHSNQSFTYDSTVFYNWHSWMSEWTILPLSQKQLTKEDLIVYCPSCGRKKRKNSERFCPACGQEL